MGFSRRKPGLSPEKALEISLNGHSGYLAANEADWDTAVAELREMIGDRHDIASQVIGHHLGGFIADPNALGQFTLKAAAMLMCASQDVEPEIVIDTFDTVRHNATSYAPPPFGDSRKD